MTPAEKIAHDTWERLSLSRDLRVRLGEETLTDLLALDFTRSMKGHARLFQSTKAQESIEGTDLVILIHAGGNRGFRFAVQAKKLYQHEAQDRYDNLNATVKSSASSQIDILETHSQGAHAIPLYLLYNYVRRNDIQPYWHCCRCPDESQLGCTFVPSWIIRQAVSNRGHRNFHSIHASRASLPWRCLFDCPQGRAHQLSIVRGSIRDLRAQTHKNRTSDAEKNYDWVRFEPVDGGWPDWLCSRDDGTISVEDVVRIRTGTSSQDSEVSNVASLDMFGVPAGKLPRHLIMVKDNISTSPESTQ